MTTPPGDPRARFGLSSQRSIGVAIGILMERHGLDQADAFMMLFDSAREQGRRVSAVADETIAGRRGTVGLAG